MSASWLQRCGEAVRARPREAGAASAGAMILVIAAGVMLAPDEPLAPGPTATVRIGRFTEELVESGSIAAARFHLYASNIAGGPAKIVEMVREGEAARPGDVLVRFDPAGFEQELERERGALQQALAERRRAEEEVRLAGLVAEGDIQQAEQQITYAQSDLTNQEQGRGRVAIAEAETALANAEREVERALGTYEDLKPLLDRGFVTRVELDQARREWERAVSQQELAALRLATLVEYERPAALGQAKARVDAAEDELSRRREGIEARIAQARASLDRSTGQVNEIEARIAILEDKIARTVIRAEGSGLVVYRYLFFGGDRRKPQVGDEVWPNQPLLALPDASDLIVETTIREVDLHKVSASQRVTVTVDAYPDIELPATVELIGALAQENPDRAGTKFFPVTIRLTGLDDRLRTGMTARVNIEVATVEDATIVPTQAVFESDGQLYCLVFRAGNTERRLVTKIADNGIEAVVQGNLEAGEVLLLTEPGAGEDHPGPS